MYLVAGKLFLASRCCDLIIAVANILFNAVLWFIVALSLATNVAHAAEISLTLNVVARDDQVRIAVSNTGADSARDLSIVLELDGRSYQKQLAAELKPNTQRDVSFTVGLPKQRGSYPLYTKLAYLNDGKRLHILDVGYFNYAKTLHLEANCGIDTIRITDTATTEVLYDKAYSMRLFLPDEIALIGQSETERGRRLTLRNQRPEFSSNYAIFSVLESEEAVDAHKTKICPARLISSKSFQRQSLLPRWAIAAVGLFAWLSALLMYAKTSSQQRSETQVALIRYAASVGTVSLMYTWYLNAYRIADALLPFVHQWSSDFWLFAGLRTVVKTLLEWHYFEGVQYEYFFRYCADPLFFYMVFGNFFLLRYVVRPDPDTDKYWHFNRLIFSIPGLRLLLPEEEQSRGLQWNKESRLAILSLMVKGFYLPLMCSWAINQWIHVGNAINDATLNYIVINGILVEALILVDVSIFAFGYLVELPQLKNQIRSVEPTLLGWVVCLACYPPFNSFSFRLFDQPIHDHWQPATGVSHAAAITVVTVLWAIYTYASLALGPRASNLTNRGIVSTGPYRYIRHPAYVSKVLLWILTSFFLGTMNFFLIVALVVVYTLRAWTEERHLSLDLEYIEYKKKVPWALCPRVF